MFCHSERDAKYYKENDDGHNANVKFFRRALLCFCLNSDKKDQSKSDHGGEKKHHVDNEVKDTCDLTIGKNVGILCVE